MSSDTGNNYDYVNIGGYSSDTKITLTKETYDRGFIWVTVMFIVLLVIVVSLIIWGTVEFTKLPPPPTTIQREFQFTINPVILTEKQCLGVPNATWDESGCSCLQPYVGDFCKEQLTSFVELSGHAEISAETIRLNNVNFDDCQRQCGTNTLCSGFVYDGTCRLLQNDIKLRNYARNKKAIPLYLKNQKLSRVEFENKVFLSKEFSVSYWKNASTILSLGKISKINFLPSFVNSSKNGIIGVYSSKKFTSGDIRKFLRDTPEYVFVSRNSNLDFPSAWVDLKKLYVVYFETTS